MDGLVDCILKGRFTAKPYWHPSKHNLKGHNRNTFKIGGFNCTRHPSEFLGHSKVRHNFPGNFRTMGANMSAKRLTISREFRRFAARSLM
jgi:hypothetical protein